MPSEFWQVIAVALPLAGALWSIASRLSKIEATLESVRDRVESVEQFSPLFHSEFAKLAERVTRIEEKVHQ